jgi:flagellar protein FliO/FliZ
MTQTLALTALFLLALACLPWAIRWVSQRRQRGGIPLDGQAKFISAFAVGQHQRVVTVEAGPEGQRVWLTLGVTPQNITCLYVTPVEQSGSAHALNDSIAVGQ